jgi:ketosteroid isomerase-like protein
MEVSMSNEQSTEVVKTAYAAFMRGDIPAVLTLLGSDVDWQPLVGAAPHVPMSGRRVGVDQVAEFFRILDANTTFSQFEPREYIAQGERVVAIGFYAGTAKKTGRTFKSEWAMAFTVRNGKVVHFREYCDTGSVNAAFDPVVAAVKAAVGAAG